MESNYSIEISGAKDLFKGELELVKRLAQKTMGVITQISDYNKLKISLKPHGNTKNTTQKKFSLNLLLSRGNKVVHVRKKIVRGTSDEVFNDRVNTANWSVTKTFQNALEVLENKISRQKDSHSSY